MCTMFTFSRQFYKKNKGLIVDQIIQDAFTNAEGYSLLGIGEDAENTTLVRSMNIDFILDTIDSLMWGESVDRVWLHLRMATTSFVGVNGCHGFAGKHYSVFHNGILSRPESDRFNVDSELIANDIEYLGVKRALDNLTYDTYANVFIVNNETGTYHVVRRTTGSLYTDKLGNYSSHPFGTIMIPVDINTQMHHDTPIVWVEKTVSSLPPKNFGNRSTFNSWEYDWYRAEYEDESEEVKYQLEALRYANSFKDFADMAEYEHWIHKGLPEVIRENLNHKQIGWAIELGMLPSIPSSIGPEIDEESEADELEAKANEILSENAETEDEYNRVIQRDEKDDKAA